MKNILVLGRVNKDKATRPCPHHSNCITCSYNESCYAQSKTQINNYYARKVISGK